MNESILAGAVEQKVRVRTNRTLEETTGMRVNKKHILARKANAVGTLDGFVPGHGGDVLWITHNDGSTGAYTYKEFEALTVIYVYKAGDHFSASFEETAVDMCGIHANGSTPEEAIGALVRAHAEILNIVVKP